MNVSVSCGSKMAAATNTAFGRLEGKEKETIPFIRKSNSLPTIPQHTAPLFPWPDLSQGHSLPQRRLQSESLLFWSLEWRQCRRRRLGIVVVFWVLSPKNRVCHR